VNCLGLCGVAISCFLNEYLICIGRLIFGIQIGVTMAMGPAMIGEIVPQNLLSIYGPFFSMMINFGITLANCFGLLVPTDDLSFETTGIWRWIFAFPAVS